MAASYPGAVKTFTNPTPTDQRHVLSHAGQHDDENDEIHAIETELGTDPKTITDATTPAASPGSVAAFLDMVATQLKTITGGANWYTAPLNTLVYLVGRFNGTTGHTHDGTDGNGPIISAGSSGHTIKDEGSALTSRSNLNFVGPGVTASDASPDTKVLVYRWEVLTDGASNIIYAGGDVVMIGMST
jgi:hypothetical protein